MFSDSGFEIHKIIEEKWLKSKKIKINKTIFFQNTVKSNFIKLIVNLQIK